MPLSESLSHYWILRMTLAQSNLKPHRSRGEVVQQRIFECYYQKKEWDASHIEITAISLEDLEFPAPPYSIKLLYNATDCYQALTCLLIGLAYFLSHLAIYSIANSVKVLPYIKLKSLPWILKTLICLCSALWYTVFAPSCLKMILFQVFEVRYHQVMLPFQYSCFLSHCSNNTFSMTFTVLDTYFSSRHYHIHLCSFY